MSTINKTCLLFDIDLISFSSFYHSSSKDALPNDLAARFWVETVRGEFNYPFYVSTEHNQVGTNLQSEKKIASHKRASSSNEKKRKKQTVNSTLLMTHHTKLINCLFADNHNTYYANIWSWPPFRDAQCHCIHIWWSMYIAPSLYILICVVACMCVQYVFLHSLWILRRFVSDMSFTIHRSSLIVTTFIQIPGSKFQFLFQTIPLLVKILKIFCYQKI